MNRWINNLKSTLDKYKRFENGWTFKEAYQYYKRSIDEAKREDWKDQNMSFFEWLESCIVIDWNKYNN